ncbi:MAG: cytochrome c [bacterium]|nr:cytochrome c [bacterium]
MKKLLTLATIALAVVFAASIISPSTVAEEAAEMAAGELDGKALFTDTHKCNMCHAVPVAEIAAKTKNEKMKGADLGGKVEGELAEIAAYVRKEADIDGKTHKKPFKGTDEELQAIIDWLGSLEAQE